MATATDGSGTRPEERPTAWRIASALLTLLFLYLFFVNAWIVDEAYITFRTVDNFLHGYGLTWNTGERVQAYTHPLWMFVMAALTALTSEVFYTSLALSLACGVVVLMVAARFLRGEAPWKLSFFLLLLVGSKSYVDYTTSGLENPLSHVLVAVFALLFGRVAEGPRPADTRSVCTLFALAAVAAVNRLDTILFFIPALAWILARDIKLRGPRLLVLAGLASLPLFLWLGFSYLYYGFPFPNTYYAKLGDTGQPLGWTLKLGLLYFVNGLAWDAVTMVVLAAAAVVALQRRSRASLWPLAGAGLYLGYVLVSAASATHMSGRFFSVAFVVAAMVLARELTSRRVAVALAVLVVGYQAFHPRAPVKFGTRFHATTTRDPSVMDTKQAVLENGSALLAWSPDTPLPDHERYREGLAFRASEKRVAVMSAPGFFAYAAGPEKWIIDSLGLCDPLLARLPGRPRARGGHFARPLPAGYFESIERGENRLEDPNLREFYRHIQVLTQGPLWGRERFLEILRMNTGRYRPLLDAYVATAPKRPG